MSLLYRLFGVDLSLRESLPSLSIHDEGLDRGWTFVFSLLCLAVLIWLAWHSSSKLKIWQTLLLAGLRWAFLLGLFFILVRPVLVLSGEEIQGIPELVKIDLSTSPWILLVVLLCLCSEWWCRQSWRLK